MDVDSTRCVARQRALPQVESLPAPHRRFDQVCAPGYQGRKRGEVVRSQAVCVESSSQISPSLAKAPTEKILTRAERAHWRLSWQQRLARNTRPPDAPRLVVTLHGLPATFASSFGFDLLATA